MAFVMEDGNGLPNANSYVDVAFADDYFTTRAITTWTGSDDVKQAALIRATDYIDTVWGPKFLGTQAFVTDDPATSQALQFPRDMRTSYVGDYSYAGVDYVYQGSVVTGELEKPVPIPVALKKATCEYALRALTASLLVDPEVDASGAMIIGKTETVGPISETTQFYAGGGIQITQAYPAADLLLKSLVRTGGRAIRG